MTDTSTTSTVLRKQRRWLRIVYWAFSIIVLVCVAAYFVVTSSAFFKGVVLPKVGAALNAKVTVGDASISPFHEVVLRDFRIQTTGTEPLVTAPEVRLRYSLMDIIHGNMHVDELTLSSPTVVLVQNADRTSNLDPLLKAQQAKPQEKRPSQPAAPSAPMQIELKQLALKDATIRQVKRYKNGNQDVAELSHVNVTVDDVKNGQTGKLALSADISVNNNPPQPGTNGLLQAKLSGNFTFALTADLKPASIEGDTRLEVTRAEGAMAQLAAFAASLHCDATPTDIKQVVLSFQKGGTKLGELLLHGPFDMAKTEGRVAVELQGIDKRLLNLAGGASGLDFGSTTINSTNDIEVAKSASLITAAGQLNLNHLEVTRAGQTTPSFDLHADYSVIVDRSASNAVLRALNLAGNQRGAAVLHAELSNPMTIAWGNAANAVGDSTLNLAITRLQLGDWKPFLGDAGPSGEVSATLKLLSQQAGEKLTFDLDSQIANLTAGSGSSQISQATVTLSLHGQATDMKQFSVPEYKFQLARQNQPLVSVSGSATYNQSTQAADVQLTAQLMLARLLQAMPRPDVNVSSGTADLKLHITQAAQPKLGLTQSATGNLSLADFTGGFGGNSVQNLGVTADLDAGVTPQEIQIRKLAGKVTQANNAGGAFGLSLTFNRTNQATQLSAKLADINQNGLGLFLQPMLADKKLVSVALNADASVQYNPQTSSTVKADLRVANLVINDPKGQVPATPLEASLLADASLNKKVADIRQFQIALTPTARGRNLVQLTGHLDMTRSNAIEGNIKLAADSLDLTTYYDLFGGQKKPGGQQPAQAATPASSGPQKEPAATQLPLHNFTADATVGRLYLHEIEIADLQATAKIDGGHVVLNPFKLSLNGAPVNSTLDLDLGVPGYKYNTSFSATAVPLAPLMNSFQPDRKGQLSGTLTATSKITGAGVTGASLQKNLSGQFNLDSTNLNLAVRSITGDSVYTKGLKAVLDVITTIPDLVKNPAGTVMSLLGGATGGGSGSSSGVTADLTKSPINSIIVRGNIGSGRVNLQQATVQSPAFEAGTSGGTITFADELPNSALNVPISVSLERSIAQRINLGGTTATNAAYARLPDFLSEKGTVSAPKMDVNYPVLAAAVLKQVGGNAGQVGGLLQGLTGASSGGTTNAAGSLLQSVGSLLGGQTPAAAPNAPPVASSQQPTNQNPVGNLLNQFLKPKKK